MLKRIEIENYKSLHKVGIDLPDFSVMVGPNAAGKTNFANAIDFISSVARNGLPTAVNDYGGYENICFRRARRARGAIQFFLNVGNIAITYAGKEIEFQYEYKFAFKAVERTISSEYQITKEFLRVRFRNRSRNKNWYELIIYDHTPPKEVSVIVNNEIENKFLVPPEDFLKRVFKKEKPDLTSYNLILASKLRGLPPFMFLIHFLENLRVFQIMPSSASRAASASGTQEMDKNGGNLPAALHFLQRENKKQFINLLEQLKLAVPTVEKIETDYVETRQLGLFLSERGMSRRMYASELSDGTLRTIALFVPLIDKRYAFIVIEEPENCIHPWVTRQFVNACREQSNSKQIILTTHSPVLVSQLKPDELFLVDRYDGQTRIQRAIEVDNNVEEIIRQGITDLGRYWDSGAMRAVPVQLPLFEDEK